MNAYRVLRISAGLLFVVASVWIHFEVKVAMGPLQGGARQQLGGVKVGAPAANFSARDMADQEVTLTSFRGQKVVLLDFWMTWCGPCRRAMPALQALHEDFHDQGLEILSVNQGEAPQAVQQFVHERGYTLHVLVDPDRRIGGQYGVYSIPTLVVIDKQGRIQRIHIGTEDMKELRPLLERLTKE